MPAFDLAESLQEDSHFSGNPGVRKRRHSDFQFEGEVPDLYDDIRFTQWQADYAEEVRTLEPKSVLLLPFRCSPES